jgi:hypothetical protein
VPSQPGRSVSFIVFVALGVVVLGLIIANFLLNKRSLTHAAGSTATAATASPMTADSASQSNPDLVSRIARNPHSSGLTDLSTGNSSAAQQVLEQLTQLKTNEGKLTPEQAEQIQQNLQQLVAQGATAIPAIREFLEKNQDWNFGKWPSGTPGAPSVRTGLLDALAQIGGPEAIALSQHVLQTTADPLEIALLARNLDQAAPGQYSQQAVDAAAAVLDQAAHGTLTNIDVGPLFQVLQNYGGSAGAAELEKLAPQWGYYSTLALAQLPSGQGIPALERMAVDSSAAGIGNRDFAVQMLGQVAAKYPDAGTALVDLARQNEIPDTSWRSLADVLGGMQYQFSRQFPDNVFTPIDGSGLRTYRQPIGNQNFVSTTLPAGGPGADISQRLALIDQLIAANPGPAALQALQQARARLTR